MGYAAEKAWGGGKTLVQRLRSWAPEVRNLGIGDGPCQQVAADMGDAADEIEDLQNRLAVATGWMRAKGATAAELKRMGLPKPESR